MTTNVFKILHSKLKIKQEEPYENPELNGNTLDGHIPLIIKHIPTLYYIGSSFLYNLQRCTSNVSSTWFPNNMMFLSFISDTTGATSKAGAAYPSGAPELSSGFSFSKREWGHSRNHFLKKSNVFAWYSSCFSIRKYT
jgi:hypothetical protein